MDPLMKFVFIVLYLISFFFLSYWLILYLETQHRIKKEKKIPPDLKKYPFVSILVPAHNEEKTILKTLKSLVNLDYPNDSYEILILNNASKDRTQEVSKRFIQNHGNNIIRYEYVAEQGKGLAMNKGLKIAKGKYFACLDADSVVDKYALKHMVAKFERSHDKLTILTPVMKIKEPKTLIQRIQRIEYIFAALHAKLMSYVDSNYVAPGPFSLYRKNKVCKLGGFCESSLVEDQEIAYKIQKAHLKIAQCSNAYVYTIGPDNFKGFRKQRNRWIKGTIFTVWDYKKLLFNRKYGDFGIFQLPIIFIYYFLGLFSLFITIYYIIKPLYQTMKKLFLLNFDIMPFIKSFKFVFDFWSIDFLFTFLIYVLFITSFIFLFIASRTNNDSLIRKEGLLPFILYYYVYFLLLSVIVVTVFYDILTGKRQKW